MRIRTVALWAVLGMAGSSAAALAVPVSNGRSLEPTPGTTALDPQPVAVARFTSGDTLTMDGRLAHAAVARSTGTGGSADTFLLASVVGSETASASAPPMNLAIVIDRSGSMKGARIGNAMNAAAGIVERMRDIDQVTVVAFDTTADVVVPPTRAGAGSRGFIESAIRNIRLGADTCMSCGLEVAMSQLQGAPLAGDHVDRMILLSDGEANHGVKDVPGLRGIAARMRDRGCSITTMGVDVDFDEKVMAAIASESNGRHYFVQNASSLPAIFEQEFDSLLATVARDGELEVKLAPGVEVEQVFDRSYHVTTPAPRDGASVVVPFGSFSAKQEKTVLMKLRVPADKEGIEPVASMKLRYRDLSRRTDATCGGDLTVLVTDDAHAQADLDPFVAARLARSETAEALTTANALFEQGRVGDAEKVLSSRRASLHRAAALATAAAHSRPVAPPAKKDAVAFADDFEGQIQDVAKAERGFAPPPPAQAAGGPAVAAAPAETRRAGKAATRQNQAEANELGL